ncbi:hypothetical protein [Dyadobacter psychrotolerans]|uniref:Uncharacterized protein n=1 Tax=Dyadobacter psychrotolerans TaxID=2541721 RepID=A0A4R5DS85_9BACT|nr:hypothetical protein [Dyadobacter psychrotolerans]TDE15204.1 hypothetical protein E0F88_11810 [Dyadobacter psychrotolerans]
MARYNVNNIIDNRYLLTENLSYDALSGRQVWAAKDNHTGKRLIGRFEPNGRVEWYDDNRPVSKAPAPKPTQTFSGPPKLDQLAKKSNRFRSLYPIFFLLGVLVIALGYYRKDQWLDRFKETTDKWGDQSPAQDSHQPTEEFADTTAVYTQPFATEQETESLPGEDSEQPEPISEETYESQPQPTGYPMNWSNAAVQLKFADELSVRDRQTLFANAADAFAKLRQSGSNRKIIDSLYIVYKARGAKYFLVFQNDASSGSRQNAVAWYQLAYSLNPSRELKEHMRSLENPTPVNSSKRAKTVQKKKQHGPTFLPDPEIK